MNAEIYSLTEAQRDYVIENWPDNKACIQEAVELSTDIIVGLYNGQRLCFIGLAPITLISDTAYIWMMITKAGEQHKLILARRAKSVIETALEKYPCLIGHCFAAESARWLRSLGAEFISDTEFEIRRG